MPWSTPFEDPILPPDGRELLTLKEAADCIMKLPKKESGLPERQTAIEALMLCSRGSPTMMAQIGVMKALNRHVERVLNPDRKDSLRETEAEERPITVFVYVRSETAITSRSSRTPMPRRPGLRKTIPKAWPLSTK